MSNIKSLLTCLSLALLLIMPPSWASAAPIVPVKTVVIKATAGVCPKGKICHVDRAGKWIPKTKVAIIAVSIAEQVDVSLYTDMEISTKPQMYMCNEEDATGCIFRMKYVGPGLFDYGARAGNTYLGSNITNTNLSFPSGYGIVIPAGTTVYAHLNVRNQSLIDLRVDQDAWIYYVALPDEQE